ncbi:hypothetical protein F4810DRAFT_683279 [Camillea tinctor]|nr:hypothetical protein F4810DRAFT_683279 [Camillea tinctor]
MLRRFQVLRSRLGYCVLCYWRNPANPPTVFKMLDPPNLQYLTSKVISLENNVIQLQNQMAQMQNTLDQMQQQLSCTEGQGSQGDNGSQGVAAKDVWLGLLKLNDLESAHQRSPTDFISSVLECIKSFQDLPTCQWGNNATFVGIIPAFAERWKIECLTLSGREFANVIWDGTDITQSMRNGVSPNNRQFARLLGHGNDCSNRVQWGLHVFTFWCLGRWVLEKMEP